MNTINKTENSFFLRWEQNHKCIYYQISENMNIKKKRDNRISDSYIDNQWNYF